MCDGRDVLAGRCAGLAVWITQVTHIVKRWNRKRWVESDGLLWCGGISHSKRKMFTLIQYCLIRRSISLGHLQLVEVWETYLSSLKLESPSGPEHLRVDLPKSRLRCFAHEVVGLLNLLLRITHIRSELWRPLIHVLMCWYTFRLYVIYMIFPCTGTDRIDNIHIHTKMEHISRVCD